MIQQAREWESSGEYARAVECYMKITPKLTSDLTIMEKCWMKVQLIYYDMSINFQLQSNLYIKDTAGNLKICPLYTGSNYIHYSLNKENKTSLYKQ